MAHGTCAVYTELLQLEEIYCMNNSDSRKSFCKQRQLLSMLNRNAFACGATPDITISKGRKRWQPRKMRNSKGHMKGYILSDLFCRSFGNNRGVLTQEGCCTRVQSMITYTFPCESEMWEVNAQRTERLQLPRLMGNGKVWGAESECGGWDNNIYSKIFFYKKGWQDNWQGIVFGSLIFFYESQKWLYLNGIKCSVIGRMRNK